MREVTLDELYENPGDLYETVHIAGQTASAARVLAYACSHGRQDERVLRYALETKPKNCEAAFRFGVDDAFCEVVAGGVKKLALSHATSDMDLFTYDCIGVMRAASLYSVRFYYESDLITTPLFKNSGSHALLIFRDEQVLEQYLALKQSRQNELDKARAYGELLSYDEKRISFLLSQRR